MTDAEWEALEPLVAPATPRARPRLHPHRCILDAIFSIVRGGGAWRLLPRGLLPWKTVFHYARKGRLDGTWHRVHCVLRERLRIRWDRRPQPSAEIIDGQSVKTAGVGGVRDANAGKQVKGRTCHLLVETEEFVLNVALHPANSIDRDGVKLLLPVERIRTLFPRLHSVWLDAGYNGRGKGREWIERTLGWSAQIIQHRRRPSKGWIFEDLPDEQIDWSEDLPPPGFWVPPSRWVV